jgi:hypothetical protein
MTSTLFAAEMDKEAVVSILENGDTLVCRGCMLRDGTTSATSHQALAACSTISQCLVLDGITLGDVQAGLRHTRHARTLSALFRSRAALSQTAAASSATTAAAAASNKQVLVLAVSVHENEPLDDTSAVVVQQVRALFQAATFGLNGPKNLEDWYDLRITPISSSAAAASVRMYSIVVSAHFDFVAVLPNEQYLWTL